MSLLSAGMHVGPAASLQVTVEVGCLLRSELIGTAAAASSSRCVGHALTVYCVLLHALLLQVMKKDSDKNMSVKKLWK